MPEDGSPRPRPMRRLLLAMARAVGLLILVTGIHGALAIALPQTPPLNRYIAALVAGVILFEMLRRPRRPRAIVTAPGEEPVLLPADLMEAQRSIDDLRAETESARSEADARVAALTRDLQDSIEANTALRQMVERAESSIGGLSQALEQARASAADEARARAGEAAQARTRESQNREKYEAESNHLQHAASKAMEEVQRTRATADELRGQFERERARANATQQSADSLAAERKKLESQIADFDKRFASAKQEMDALRTEVQRARRDAEEARQKSEVEKAALRTSMEAEWSAKLQKIVGELATDHENDIGEAIAARESARAEVRNLIGQLHELQKEVDLTRKSSQQLLHANEALTQQLDEERQGMQAEVQRLIAESTSERDALQSEARALLARLDAVQKQLDQRPVVNEKALRESIDAEWSKKLQKIVTELAMDHENDIGDSIAAREAARAEARSLNLRVQDLEKQLHSARDGRLGLLQRDDELTHRLARLEEDNAALKAQLQQSRPVLAEFDEKALRENVEAEWSEKLQTIVSHIATDHESDIGKAIEEREAARAEARNLAIKMNALQQKLDAERQNFAAAQDKWNGMRDSLHSRIREAEDEVTSMKSVPPPPPPEPPPAAPPVEADQEEQRARAEVLEFAEQAHEALRRITSPGDAPIATEKKARILFVHHDPALRTMWRDNLGKSGFDVQTAADGLEGLRLAKIEKPDVVIADASMPKMDGRELCQLIKSNEETASVKVVLMTGIYTTEVPMDSVTREFEADELLRKPVKLEAMKTALSSLLAAKV